MKIHIVPVSGLVAGIGSAAQTETRRDGLLLELSDGKYVGRGEAAPWPGFSRETRADAAAALRCLDGERLSAWLDCDDAFTLLSRIDTGPASARFAVETALLDLLGQRLGRSLPSLLGAIRQPVAPAVALRIAPDLESRARQALANSAAIKVKIGRPGAFEAELSSLQTLRAALGDFVLRLDANRAFADDVVDQRLAALAELQPQFVEEPFQTGVRGRQLDGYPVPIAVDESLLDTDVEDILQGRPKAVIVKPMALGLAVSIDIARRASATAIATVISHLWDGPRALDVARALALAVPSPTWAPGLADHPGLDIWR